MNGLESDPESLLSDTSHEEMDLMFGQPRIKNIGVLFLLIQTCSCHYLLSGNEANVGLVPFGGRVARQAPPPRVEACTPFVVGDENRRELYSPGWPNPYPNHTDCKKVLEAPKGYLLKLDFRDFFDLEPSPDCKFDFLEVRDGAHGYGKLLGQYCGKDFPPMIISTDRYLWLHFRSDENIEYAGFKAVYEYVERPKSSSSLPEMDTCRFYLNGSEAIFGSSQISDERKNLTEKYGVPLDCMWIITVKEGWKIQLTFPVFKLQKPNDCDSNFLDVFSDRTDLPARQENYCGSIADPVPSKNNTMFVRFVVEAGAIKSNFEALFTAYREKTNECAPDEYDCDDATCISLDLRCNGRINCRLRWDEDECDTKKSALLNSEHIIIIMVIFSLILSGMCFTFFYNCIKKLIRDHHTIQEHIRQSREHQLNVLGHKGLEEAAIAAEAKKVMTEHSLSNSSHSSPSQKFEPGAKEQTPCYVPGGELLPILIKGNDHRFNGELYGMMPRETSFPEHEEKYEMCDSACQTRESLFDPPPIHQHSPTPAPHPSPPAPFSTFGYKKEDRYRTEGKIHIEKIADKHQRERGPYSIQSTKSAPDVIVTH